MGVIKGDARSLDSSSCVSSFDAHPAGVVCCDESVPTPTKFTIHPLLIIKPP